MGLSGLSYLHCDFLRIQDDYVSLFVTIASKKRCDHICKTYEIVHDSHVYPQRGFRKITYHYEFIKTNFQGYHNHLTKQNNYHKNFPVFSATGINFVSHQLTGNVTESHLKSLKGCMMYKNLKCLRCSESTFFWLRKQL